MKSNKTKSAMTALVVAAMLCSAAMPIRAAEAQWVNNNGTWSYVKEDGSIAKGWIKDNNCWYAFDDNGAMRTGWIASNEHWYFMGESGVMQADAWVEDNGARYYIKGTGVMAKDYVKDGYELTEDGKAIPLAESKSVVLTDPEAIEGEVIEGNLYVDVTTAKALELKGVTVKGKLVVIGDNKTAGKLTITDSKIESISTQTRNTEVVLSGETEVKTIVLEETAAVTPDKNFKGEVEKIEVQSTTKGEIVIEVPAQEVSTRTYASVDIQAPVESLEVKTDTQIKVNADVKNVVVTESAKDTKVEVSKGNTVGTITADAPVKIEGSGTINKVEANVDGVEAGKDTVIKDVETGKDVEKAPEVNKPSTGGSSSGGSTVTSTTYEVSDEATLLDALSKAATRDTIKLKNNLTVSTNTIALAYENDQVKSTITIDLNDKTLNLTGNTTIAYANKTLIIKNGKIEANDYGEDGTNAVFNPLKAATVTLDNVEMATNGSALFPQGNAASVTVNNSKITAGVYAVGTNAGADDNYGVQITVTDSYLYSTGWKNNDKDDCTVMINVGGDLTIKNSYIEGDRQALVVRAGTADVINSTIVFTGNWGESTSNNNNQFYGEAWGGGNNLPSAPVVIGSRSGANVYKAAASLTLTNCTINGSNEVTISGQPTNVQIYMYGREAYKATLTITDQKSYDVVQGETTYTTVNGLPEVNVPEDPKNENTDSSTQEPIEGTDSTDTETSDSNQSDNGTEQEIEPSVE
ncbi:N-acetylmuramoyl-L-alanine amidase family protein [Dielma fastidiosa]|uniref:N-acetylmuramoyl-L-alanine amidase family protein n=1 Tax=Dielma fastidiosa TaxID=1034346 RepID=UPI0034B20E81